MQSKVLGKVIAWHRRRAKLSQNDLARHAGLSRFVIQDIEAGKGRTSFST